YGKRADHTGTHGIGHNGDAGAVLHPHDRFLARADADAGHVRFAAAATTTDAVGVMQPGAAGSVVHDRDANSFRHAVLGAVIRPVPG
ncbi:MAG: hypothetical protein ABR604_00445, partial [Jatrophihabitantaceae bacterium]